MIIESTLNKIKTESLHYVNTLKQKLDGTRAYPETDTDEVSVVNGTMLSNNI